MLKRGLDDTLATLARFDMLIRRYSDTTSVSNLSHYAIGDAWIKALALQGHARVMHHDTRAARCEQPNICLAQSAPAAGHDGYLSIKANHLGILLIPTALTTLFHYY